MRVHKLRPWERWLFIGFLASLAACQAPVAPIRASSVPSTTITVVSPTVYPRSTYTPTPRPTVPTNTPSVSPAPVSPAATPHPTLTAEEQHTLVRELMQSNGGCELPCWWGIVPGQSEWQDIWDRFQRYGLRGKDYYFGFSFMRPGQIQDSCIRLRFVVRDGIVEGIQVEGQWLNSVSEYFAQDWQRYSLDNVLRRYGQPSQVLISLAVGLEGGAGYGLLLLYDHLGIAISYGSFSATVIQGEPLRIRVCPRHEEVFGIILWLQSPQEKTSLLQQAPPYFEISGFRPLEETVGMSLEDFYEVFKNPDSGVCLEGPPTWWP